jgi:hypothetical protein
VILVLSKLAEVEDQDKGLLVAVKILKPLEEVHPTTEAILALEVVEDLEMSLYTPNIWVQVKLHNSTLWVLQINNQSLLTDHLMAQEGILVKIRVLVD